ncbi:MAG TPA: hypothetical protein VIY90_18670 [Steroidobacteraceae bacterium]
MLAVNGNPSVDSRDAFVANPESSLRIVDLLLQPYVAGVNDRARNFLVEVFTMARTDHVQV